MKDALAGIALAAALAVVFSFLGPGIPSKESIGTGTQTPGDFGPILPGDGDFLAELPPETSGNEDPGKELHPEQPGKEKLSHQKAAGKAGQFHSNESKEDHADMCEMLAFWHGVAAVLIGESCALMVAAACLRMKIRADRKEKENG